MKNRILLATLAATTFSGLLAIGGTWTDGNGNVWTYSLSDDNATITAVTPVGGVLVVPPEVDGYRVVGIGNTVGKGCGGVTSLSIPDTVRTMFVARLYTKALGRGYDIGGLNNWCNRINTSRTPKTAAINAAVGFFHSAEFKNRRLSNAAYVDVLYNTFLGRNPDAAGRANWIRRLNGGMSRDAAMAGFYNSAEFNAIMAGYGIR